METSLSIHIFRPLGAAEDQLERWLAGGVSGARFRPGGMPLVVTTGKDQSTETRAEGEAPGWNPSSPELLASFTSDPLPTMTARGSTGKQVQVIDPGSCAPGSAIDMVFAERLVSPMVEPSGEPALQEVWSLVNSPSRHLVFDVYLHERLERRFRPAVDAQLWYPNLASPGDNRWLTRLPGQPRLELLGRGLGRAATGASPRHGELTEHLFARAGLEASAYLGFRCEVAFPVWRAGYRFAFEHTPD